LVFTKQTDLLARLEDAVLPSGIAFSQPWLVVLSALRMGNLLAMQALALSQVNAGIRSMAVNARAAFNRCVAQPSSGDATVPRTP